MSCLRHIGAMKRKPVILVALSAVLAVAAGVAVWRLLSPAASLSAPIELVEIAPGEFLMGSPEDEADRNNDETQHLVRITYAFKMGKYEVTQKQWREVMGTTIQQQRDKAQRKYCHLPSFIQRLKALEKGIKDAPFAMIKAIKDNGLWRTLKWLAVSDPLPIIGEGDYYPMYYVNWEEATEFCQRLTDLGRAAGRLPVGHVYRLPTEAEWEYACRAGSTTRFANGDTEPDLDKIAWYLDNSGGTTHPVGTKLPNAWGLHDLHGNVWEWCHDWYGDYPSGSVTDPHGALSAPFQVARGGGWGNTSRYCRSAARGVDVPGNRDFDKGFRVVLAPQTSATTP